MYFAFQKTDLLQQKFSAILLISWLLDLKVDIKFYMYKIFVTKLYTYLHHIIIQNVAKIGNIDFFYHFETCF